MAYKRQSSTQWTFLQLQAAAVAVDTAVVVQVDFVIKQDVLGLTVHLL
jgi:hypothetical protein